MVMNLFEFSVNIIESFLLFLFLSLYFGCKYNGLKKVAGFLMAVVITVAVITYLNTLYIYEGFFCLVFILINSLYSCLFLKGDIYTKLFISGFIDCIIYFISLFLILCTAEILAEDYTVVLSMSAERVFFVLMTKILFILVGAILLKFKSNNIVRRKSMIILIIMPIVAELSMVGITQSFSLHYELKHELMLATTSIMLANFLAYYLFIKINRDAEHEMKIKALEQKEEYDKRHADEVDELYTKVCGIRHDLLNHFTMLKGLLDEGNESAKEYIQSVTQEQIQQIKTFVKTDNDYFDAIVNAKLAVCEKTGIKVRTRIMNGALSKLNNYEIASLFGNLFDNAIEATRNSKLKRIDLDVQLQQGHLSIFMKNTIDGSVLEHNKNLITTKKNKEYHGLGTKNIRKIVDMQNGIINYFEENGYFCCDILL